jgi:hypothetical protein
MPKRVIDGDSLWVSEKLTNVPEKYRAEYAWILPLANANGCFECSPMLVWRTCYSALRTGWSIDDVVGMLDAFEAAKMLFRWKVDGKTYGFFVGIQKEGRLPKPSDRVKSAKQWQSGMVPTKELASFLGLTAKKIAEDYRDEVATNSRVTRGKVARKSPTGNGAGVGSGSGLGTGGGDGDGIGSGKGMGIASGDGAVSPPTLSSNTLPPANTFTTDNTSTRNTQHSNTSTSFDPDEDDDELAPPEPVKPDELFDSLTPLGFGRIFRHILYQNPKAGDPPKGWAEMWEKDFKQLCSSLSNRELLDIIIISQIEKNQQFYVRPAKLIENLSLLKEMVKERRKALPALRVQFRKDVKKLEQAGHQW